MEDIGRRWRKSGYSGNGGECVEVGHARDVIAVRDTRQGGAGPVLRFSPAAWRRFAGQMKRSLAPDLEPGSLTTIVTGPSPAAGYAIVTPSSARA